MLDTLRANSRSVLTYVLFGIIILVFVISFGPGSKGCGAVGTAETWAARVNGSKVTPLEFEQQYTQLARLYQAQTAADTTGLLALRIRQMAMDQVVERELVEQEAQKKGLVVRDEDVSAAVAAIPTFQTNGRFDKSAYERAVTAAYGTPRLYEERLRRDLLYTKMMALVRENARVTDDEVKDAWVAENDRVSLEFARFPVALARADVHATDAQLQAFMAKEGTRIEKYYADNKQAFDKPKRVRARHILAKVDRNAPAAEWDAAKKKIEGYAERVKKGEDFAELAKKYSDDPGSADKGGDLGTFGPRVMANEFEAAAFKMKAGEISEPVKTAFGYHLIKVESVQEAEVIPLDKARPDIARTLLEGELADKLAHEKAQATLAKLQAGKTFAEALPVPDPKAPKKGPEPVKLGGQPVKSDETGSFNAQSKDVPRIGPAPEIQAAALAATASGQVLPKIFDTPAGPIVVKVKERVKADPAKFEEKKSEVELRLRMRREAELERGWVEDLRKRADVKTNEAFVQGTARSGGPVQLD
jgi:peptidyl-prolyl cis-trans isomerase D